jgi:hypothetical protein
MFVWIGAFLLKVVPETRREKYISTFLFRGRRGRDRMVVGFITTCAINVYHNYPCEFNFRSGEVYSIQHYVALNTINHPPTHVFIILLFFVDLVL